MHDFWLQVPDDGVRLIEKTNRGGVAGLWEKMMNLI